MNVAPLHCNQPAGGVAVGHGTGTPTGNAEPSPKPSFAQYRRSHELRQKMDNAWAWQMYSNYYDELASSRQQGFEMLFNEVYAQVYDRVLREKQREPEA